ncbi:uncharacterized protein JCM15063_006512 [Sporobolomyces koalae]|uniref:uncharacterized protein n=1 Tax=Sporobolomyces koalae TaxID=500713 RepID=UPI00316F04AF
MQGSGRSRELEADRYQWLPSLPREWGSAGQTGELGHNPRSCIVTLNFAIATVFITQTNNGYDSALISSFQALAPWRADLRNPSPSKVGLLNLAAYLAGLCTAPFAAWSSDRYGRRICIRYAAVTMVIGSIMGSCADQENESAYSLFITSRAIIGSGLAFGVMVSPILLQELPHPSQRQTLAGLFNTFYIFGSIIAAWLLFGTSFISNSWSWRIPYIVQIGPALFALVAIFFVPESPRFHLNRGDEKACMDFLIKYHGNGEETELVRFEFEEMKETLTKEKEMRKHGWNILWANRPNRHRTALVLWIGFCQALSGQAIITFYYTSILKLVGITQTQQVVGINGGLQIFNWICSLYGAYLVPRVPRRKLLMSAWLGVLVSNVWVVASSARYAHSHSKAAGIATVIGVWFYDGFYNLVCGPLFFSMTAEVLSFHIRAKGMMANALLVKVLSIANSYMNPVALSAIGWRYYLVYTGLIIVQLVGWYVLAVDTNGCTLEEIAILFEGKHGAVPDPERAAAIATATTPRPLAWSRGTNISFASSIKKTEESSADIGRLTTLEVNELGRIPD